MVREERERQRDREIQQPGSDLGDLDTYTTCNFVYLHSRLNYIYPSSFDWNAKSGSPLISTHRYRLSDCKSSAFPLRALAVSLTQVTYQP